ncbi:phosphatidate cytidylyltransferase, partial [Jatrophihabitans sp.]|uniref:phosphatidate cytidylyltransferase n=1 Tax=Jatrophihabitans sp. TaxID=1932789 RepID=UPI0030C6AE86|nr:hypothetical protein [Jatrophihabitans sp.]
MTDAEEQDATAASTAPSGLARARRSGISTPAPLTAPAETPAPPKSRAGRDLRAAIGVGLGLGALIIASLFVYRPSFAILVGAAVVYGCYELCKAIATTAAKPSVVPLVVGGVASLVAAWERGPSGLVLGILLTLAGVILWRIADGAEGFLRDVGASTLVLLYVPTLAGFAVLSVHAHDGAARILAFVATVVCSDTGGYASGVLFGKHPLAPIVSKAKTWEGFAGSVLFCSLSGIGFLSFTFHEQWWKVLLFGLAV